MRRPDPAKVFTQAALLLCGVALTWTCAGFGLLVATHGYTVFPRMRDGKRRVQAVAQAANAYLLRVESAGPDRIDGTVDDIRSW